MIPNLHRVVHVCLQQLLGALQTNRLVINVRHLSAALASLYRRMKLHHALAVPTVGQGGAWSLSVIGLVL